jgi:hypothetical protein
LWKRVAKAAGIAEGLWSRDLRAGAATEGGQAGARVDDMAKQLGRTNRRTTAEVYDRDARARVAYRGKNGSDTWVRAARAQRCARINRIKDLALAATNGALAAVYSDAMPGRLSDRLSRAVAAFSVW